MINNIIKFFLGRSFFDEEKSLVPKKVGLFFGTNNGSFMDYLFYIKKYNSIHYFLDEDITKELIFKKIEEEVNKLEHEDSLFLYFGSGKNIGIETINFFRNLRKRIHIFIIIENYKNNFFPVPYIIHYPNQRIRIRNDEMYVPSIISIYSYKNGILKVLEESLKEFSKDKIYIRMLLLKLQDKFIDLKKDDEKLPEICISSMDCYYYKL